MSTTKEKSVYDSMGLLKIYAKTYFDCLLYTFVVGFLVLGLLYGVDYLYKRIKNPTWVPRILVYILLILLFVALIMKGKLYFLLYLYTGVSLVTALAIMLGTKDNALKVLAFTGALLMFIFPIGSFQGILSAGYFSYWIIFPIVIDHLFSIEKIDGSLNIMHTRTGSAFHINIGQNLLYGAKKFILFGFSYLCIFTAYRYPFLDLSSYRPAMTATVNNKHMMAVYTSKGRADMINELLGEISKYAKPNDYMLCYSFIPMVHYMTETRPYIRNPYTGMYSADIFQEELNRAYDSTKILPVIVVQKINTLLYTQWPKERETPITNDVFINTDRDSLLNEFIRKNNYRETLSNKVFSVFAPPAALAKE